MAMKNPVHPGAIVREDCLKPLALSVSEGARRLGVGRQTLSHLVNEKASVSIEMAYRLSKVFGSTPETWLGMRLAYDLARSRDLEDKIKLERIGRRIEWSWVIGSVREHRASGGAREAETRVVCPVADEGREADEAGRQTDVG